MFAAGLAAAGEVPLDTTEEQWWDQQAYLSQSPLPSQSPSQSPSPSQSQLAPNPDYSQDCNQWAEQQSDLPVYQPLEPGPQSQELDQPGYQEFDWVPQQGSDQQVAAGSGLDISNSDTRFSNDTSVKRQPQSTSENPQYRSSSTSNNQSSQSSVVSSVSQGPSSPSDSNINQTIRTNRSQGSDPVADQAQTSSRQSSWNRDSEDTYGASSLGDQQLFSSPDASEGGQIAPNQEVVQQLASDVVGESTPLDMEQMSFEERLQAGRECFRYPTFVSDMLCWGLTEVSAGMEVKVETHPSSLPCASGLSLFLTK